MKDLQNIFADYRYESTSQSLDYYFVEPPYYRQFIDNKTIVIMGGRGTGKTVTLRSIHFSNNKISQSKINLGIYFRATKNQVQAFTGKQLDEEEWKHAFQHYINLQLCTELLDLLESLSSTMTWSNEESQQLKILCKHFSIGDELNNINEIGLEFQKMVIDLTQYIIDPSQINRPKYSVPEVPVVELANFIHKFAGSPTSPIYICIDEWENLLEFQQQWLNCWIKNCSYPISYKLAVRAGGMKTLSTGGTFDPLNSPADYETCEIDGKLLTSFCQSVVENRLKSKNKEYGICPDDGKWFIGRYRCP